MKYLKTYEDLVTLELNKKDLVELMNYAMREEHLVLIKSLLENGYDPNVREKQWDSPLIYKAATKHNFELVKLFIDFNTNLSILLNDSRTIISSLITSAVEHHDTLIKSAQVLVERMDIILLIAKHADLSQNNYEFFRILVPLTKRRNIKGIAQEILNKIIEIKPDDYKNYIISLTSNKYNL